MGAAVGTVGTARSGARVTTTSVVSGVGDVTILVADVYAAMVVVSHRVGVADVGAGGNTVSVVDAGVAGEVGMGAVLTRADTVATAGATGVAATAAEGAAAGAEAGTVATAGVTSMAAMTAEGDADSGAASAEGGDVACGDGTDDDGRAIEDGTGCQGWGSLLNLASKVLVSTL
jgi:hypothetical protein